MHIDHNQFNSLTMSNKKHTNTISIFNKCKANQHVVNHTSNTHVNGLFSITAQLDDDLDYLTQDESKNSSNQTPNKHGDSSEEKSSDEDSTVLKHQETLTKETDNSDYEWVAETNDAHSPLIKSKQGHSTGPHKTPPVITPQTKNIKKHTNDNHNTAKKIYNSPYLDENYKLTADKINLTPELEPIRKLIMSQHKVFADWIKELGHISLSLSKTIEKKKESLIELKKDKKIPRSLRIKCELTSSPEFANDQSFLKFKEDLQNTVTDFIKKGTGIMIGWAERNLTLLVQNRCFKILKKALQLLDGLISFYSEAIGTPRFPSLPSEKINNIFLLKLYLSNEYINIDNLAEFLDLPKEEILLMGAKILTDNMSEEDVKGILRCINLSDIDINNELHDNFITETLLSFDQIMQIAILDVWYMHKEKSKQTNAAQNLEARIMSTKMIDATNTTAQAIAKATENINYSQSINLNNNLRISNLEKSVRKHEQKANEIIKAIQNKKSPQKNSTGRYTPGSVASPETKIPKKRKNKEEVENESTQQIIDLSTDKELETQESTQKSTTQRSALKTSQKKHKRQANIAQMETKGKTIQWKENETTNFNPQQPIAFTLPPQSTYIPFPQHNHFGLPPHFQPVPHPTTYVHQLQSPFQNSQILNSNLPHQGYFTTTFPSQTQWSTPQQTYISGTHNKIPFTKKNPFCTPFHQKRNPEN